MAQFACPQCHSIDELFITVEVVARLVQDDLEDDYSTEVTDNSHWWEGESFVECSSCNWSGLVKQLETPQPSKENQNGSSS